MTDDRESRGRPAEEEEAASVATHPATEDDPPLSAGTHLGRYELLGKLGSGGMSVVYLAYDPGLDRKVALKLMRARMVGPDGARRLQREAQALAKLSHPNVVPVYDVGTVEGQAFVAMEYVEGQTLRTWLKEPRAWREVLRVMIDAGRGLAAAHAAGLVHRDFKPDNVLIGADARVRVLDFGLARLAGVLEGTEPSSTPSLPPTSSASWVRPNLDAASVGGSAASSGSVAALAITRADQVVGTPAYMAPEQIRREPVDERADQFSFAVTLYEALFEQRPFALPDADGAGSTADTVTTNVIDVRRLTNPAPPPRRSPVPRWVQRAVMRALSFDPKARFPSVAGLIDALTNDPYKRARRAILAAVVGIAGALVVVAFVRTFAKNREMCRGGASRALTVWSAAAKDDVRRAFAATGAPYADAATSSAGEALDAYAREWAQMSDESCAATRLRGEQSEEVQDLRMACLSTRLREVDALVDAFRHADEATVKQAAKAARSLPPISECADVAALRAPSPRPRDVETAARVLALEQRLAVVVADVALGKNTEALSLAGSLARDAADVGFGPLVAWAELWRGRAAANLNDAKTSIPALREAFARALSSREDRVLKESSARLTQEYIYAYDARESEYWAKVAQAAIDRGTPDPTLQSFLDHARCVALWQPGKILERLACLERNAAKVEKMRALDDWELTTLGLAASDAGALARGVDYTRRGYAYALGQNGASHPRTLEMRGYVCKALLDYGDFDAALAECSEAVRVGEHVVADNGYILGKIRMYLGGALREAGRFDEARHELDLARPHVEATEIGDEIAQLELRSGHAEAAIETLRKSLADAEKDLPPVHPNVIQCKLSLGEALLLAGKTAEAKTVLEAALATTENGDLSPITVAELSFTTARARMMADSSTKESALALARRARDAYVAVAPPTKRYQDARAKVDAWIAAAAR